MRLSAVLSGYTPGMSKVMVSLAEMLSEKDPELKEAYEFS